VTPFSEIVESLARDVRLLDSERLDDNPCPTEKHVALARGLRPGLALNYYRKFQKIPRTDETTLRIVDEPGEGIGFGFPKQNGNERGGVQGHFGRPCLS
jgi:hypothetical protein